MSADLSNMLRMMGLLGDDGFVNALTRAEQLVEDVEGTLERVERIEGEAGEAVREANQALEDVDRRLATFDETISLLEAKIEAAFTVAFFFFALDQWFTGDPFLAVGLFLMGLLGISSLIVTIIKLPQVRRLRKLGRFTMNQINGDDESGRRRPKGSGESRPTHADEDGIRDRTSGQASRTERQERDTARTDSGTSRQDTGTSDRKPRWE